MRKSASGNVLGNEMRRWMQRKKMSYLKSVVKPINKRKLDYWFIPKRHNQVKIRQLLKVLNSRHIITCKYSNFVVPCF